MLQSTCARHQTGKETMVGWVGSDWIVAVCNVFDQGGGGPDDLFRCPHHSLQRLPVRNSAASKPNSNCSIIQHCVARSPWPVNGGLEPSMQREFMAVLEADTPWWLPHVCISVAITLPRTATLWLNPSTLVPPRGRFSHLLLTEA